MSRKGSHVTWGGWESRTCELCGGRLVLKSTRLAPAFQHLFFSRYGGPNGEPISRHMGQCPPPTDEE